MKISKQGLERKKAIVAELKGRISELNSKDVALVNDKDDTLTSETLDLYNSMIASEEKDILESEIIEDIDLGENFINFGDEVTFTMQKGNNEPFELTMVLADAYQNGANVVTINSPVGMALYGKEVGSVFNVQTPDGISTITIISKAKQQSR